MFGIDSSTFDLIFQAHDEASPVIEGLGEKLRSVTSIIGGGFLAGLGFEAFRGVEEALSGIVGGAVSANMNVQSLRMTLSAIYGDAREANDAFAWLTQFEKGVPFALPELQQGAVTIASLGEDITKVMPALAAAASVAQVDFTTASQAFMDAREGLNRMLERDLHIRPEQLEPFGLKIDASGKEDLNTFAAAFEAFVAKRYPNAITDQMHTLRGELSSLETQWFNIEVALGKPIFAVLQKDAQVLLDYLNAHPQDIQRWATDVGNAIAASAAVVSLAVPKAIDAIEIAITDAQTWANNLQSTLDTIGGWFDTLGTHVHTAMVGLVGGIFDLFAGLNRGIDDTINTAIGGFDKLLHKIYGATGGAAGLGPLDHLTGVHKETADEQATDKVKFLSSIFGTDYFGRGGGSADVQGGGGADYWNPETHRWQDTPYNPSNSTAPGANGLPVIGLGPQQDTAALKAAAQAALDQAKEQFSLDQLMGASHDKLLGDIGVILKDMNAKILGKTPLDIAYERAQDMKAIGDLAKQQDVVTNWRTFAPFQQAGEGQTIAAYGLSAGQNSQTQIIAHLREIVSNDERQIAMLTEQNRLLQMQVGLDTQVARATAETAQSTAELARAKGTPIQGRDPRIKAALTTAGRP